ncbi:MAG: 2-amino-4-hydroxy-6-hydroxymethyldihydropteridine diphosphokinase [Crocinitomicaceae bacterium]|nr:2-amino-4-hydroxy-6-hydroxymethyldihydropteridine diphosphokinase [Crocinitomicaceae bacterium]
MEINEAILSLGSNISPREDYLLRARNQINNSVGKITGHSKIYVTTPLGFESEDLFLNCCLKLETALSPNELLSATQKIEIELGRQSKSVNENYSSRTIDIDIIFYNQLIVETEKLKIPHQHYTKRKFVLKPLNDLKTKAFDPISYLTVQQLLTNCADNSTLMIYENQFFDSL